MSKQLWIIAFRDLGRNRRRSLLSLIAVALGLALLIVWNGLIAGMLEDSLQNSIRLSTGHLQVRNEVYEEETLSLQWQDLLDDIDVLTARISELEEVQAAAPVLWASGILNTVDDSAGLQVYGIDTTSPIHAPIQEAVVAGAFLQPDDRSGILLGQRLADSLGLGVGQNVSLAIVNADGQPDQGIFTVRGLFSTGIPNYDEGTVFLPLARAQAFTRAGGRASTIIVLLHQQSDADRVALALQDPGTTILTWEDLNAVLLQAVETGMAFYALLDAIVILVVAVVIANTLLMAVFERIREMGILAALGMKGRQIMLMFLLEAAALGLLGIAIGIVLGCIGVAYLSSNGIEIGEVASAAGNIALSTTMRARFDPGTIISLSFWTLIIILLASLYPAWFAARREPVEALHSL
jgi:ABC-type lipoprotein release transport system permease subunit